MVTPDKHLLEAFQSVGVPRAGVPPAAPAAPAPPKPATAPRPAAAAPRATGPDRAAAAPAPSRPAVPARANPRLVIAGGALAVFASGVLLGRTILAPGRAQAAEPAASPGPARGPSAGVAPAVPQVQAWPGDALVMDPAKIWTILAITYSSGAGNRTLAESTGRYLAGIGFPVARPIESANDIRLLVGGAARASELDETLKRLRTTPGPTGRSGEFQTAYTVNIDSHVDRKRRF